MANYIDINSLIRPKKKFSDIGLSSRVLFSWSSGLRPARCELPMFKRFKEYTEKKNVRS